MSTLRQKEDETSKEVGIVLDEMRVNYPPGVDLPSNATGVLRDMINTTLSAKDINMLEAFLEERINGANSLNSTTERYLLDTIHEKGREMVVAIQTTNIKERVGDVLSSDIATFLRDLNYNLNYHGNYYPFGPYKEGVDNLISKTTRLIDIERIEEFFRSIIRGHGAFEGKYRKADDQKFSDVFTLAQARKNTIVRELLSQCSPEYAILGHEKNIQESLTLQRKDNSRKVKAVPPYSREVPVTGNVSEKMRDTIIHDIDESIREIESIINSFLPGPAPSTPIGRGTPDRVKGERIEELAKKLGKILNPEKVQTEFLEEIKGFNSRLENLGQGIWYIMKTSAITKTSKKVFVPAAQESSNTVIPAHWTGGIPETSYPDYVCKIRDAIEDIQKAMKKLIKAINSQSKT